MKVTKAIIILLLFNLTLISGFSQKNLISGKLTGKASAAIKEIQLFFDGSTHRFKPDTVDFIFQAEIELKEPQFVELRSGSGTSEYIYMIPGENIDLVIEKPTLTQTIITGFSYGKIKQVNEVMDKFYETFEENRINTKGNNWQQALYNDRDLARLAIENAKNHMLANEQFFNSFAAPFKADFEIFSHSFMNYIAVDDFSLDEIEKKLEELSDSEMKNTVLTIPFYRQYISDITNAYAARKLERYTLTIERMKDGYITQTISAEALIKYIPNQAVKNYLLFDKINNELAMSGIKNRKYIDYLFENSPELVTKHFIEKYENLKANLGDENSSERVPAADFTFHDAEGKEYTLADFKGKILFIDFWASWCGPCKMQMPFFKELEKHYEGEDIVFAKVSLDTSKPAWLKSVEDDNIKGVVLHAEGAFRNSFPMKYGVNSIPRFMLIDADGKIISDNMPKPQEKKEVMSIIDAELFKRDLKQTLEKHLKAVGAQKFLDGNGLIKKVMQTFMGSINTELEIHFEFPGKFRKDMRPVYIEALVNSFGEDFFKSSFFIVANETVYSSDRKNDRSATSWINDLSGLDLFILYHAKNLSFVYADENFSNSDNQYVVETTYLGDNRKYYIDRDNYLIKRVVLTRNLPAREGGGVMDMILKYDDYRNVDGVMLPFSYSFNNFVQFKILEAEVRPIEEKVFIVE